MIPHSHKNIPMIVKSIKEILNMIFVSNLKLNIQKKEMELQTEEEKSANSNLLPKVTAGLTGVNIDKNSADSSMGSVRAVSYTHLTLPTIYSV